MSDTAVQSSSNATEEKKSEASVDVAIEAAKLIGLGRRNLLVGDAPNAVQVLQEACALLATKYGETGEELGEAYFHYGSALLELGRMESGVLGNALSGVDPQTDDDDDDGDDDTVESAEKVQGEERKKVLKDVDEALESIPDAKDAKDGKKDDDKTDAKDDDAMETDEKVVKGQAKETKDKENKMEQEKAMEQKKDGKEVNQKNDDKVDKKDDQKKEDKVDEKKDKVEPKKDDSKSTKDDAKAKDDSKKDDGAGPSTADDTKPDDKEEGEADDTAEETAEDTAEGDTADENTEKEEEGEGEDISNFQLCWEILELARVIFGKKQDKEFRLKVSQVHLKLGELGLETEQYPQSIEDFLQCLGIQKEHLEPESRLLAETHYNLGLAYCSDSRFSDAIEHFEAAKKVIEARISLLEKRLKDNEGEGKGKEKADADDPVVKDRKEIEELQDLLPEITAKLEDAKDSKKTAASAASQAIAAAAAEFGLGGGSSTNAFGAPSSSTAQVAKPIQVRKAGGGDAAAPSDISHLVRRKRKPEDEAAVDSKEEDKATSPTDAKRIKPDEKGDAAKTNGHANGTANGLEKSPDKQETKTVEKKVNGDAAPAAAMETS